MKIKSLLIGNKHNKRMIECHLKKEADNQYVIQKVGYNVANAITWKFPAKELEGSVVKITLGENGNISTNNFIPDSVQEFMDKHLLAACGWREV